MNIETIIELCAWAQDAPVNVVRRTLSRTSNVKFVDIIQHDLTTEKKIIRSLELSDNINEEVARLKSVIASIADNDEFKVDR